MRLRARIPLARSRRDHGFSVLELGIVLAVAVVLMAGVASSIQGMTRHARVTRTVDELPRILAGGQGAVARTLVVNLGTSPPTYQLSTSLPLPPGTATPISVDLSAIPAGHALEPKLKEVLGAAGGIGGIANDGFNPYGRPYILFMNAARLEVRTCVDGLDYEDSSAFRALAPCTLPGCQPDDWQCVSLSGPLVNVGAQRTRYSYDPSLFTP